MSTAVDTLLLMDSLHYATDYIPKRAIRFFTSPEHHQETISLILDEMKEVLAHPTEFVEEESQFLFYALLILGHFYAREAIPLIREIALLPQETIDAFLGEHLFDAVSLAFAQIFQEDIPSLKALIEDRAVDECIRAACLQSLAYLYGKKILSRDQLVSYLLHLLKAPREKISFFYEVIVNIALVLHPLETIDEIRKLFDEKVLESSEISRESVEEFLSLDPNEVIQECALPFQMDLEDLVLYCESIEGMHLDPMLERNEPCPCGSRQKYKKCCR
jgi:hypothetical protein